VFAVAGQAGSLEEINGRMERTRGFWQNEDIFRRSVGRARSGLRPGVCRAVSVKVVGTGGRIGLSELS
jgi:hypothetical protein